MWCLGMDCPRVRYPQLNDVVEADLAEQGYQVLTDAGQQVDKVIQLYEVRPLSPAVPSRTSPSRPLRLIMDVPAHRRLCLSAYNAYNGVTQH